MASSAMDGINQTMTETISDVISVGVSTVMTLNDPDIMDADIIDGCKMYKFIIDCIFQWVIMFGGFFGNILTCAVVWVDVKKSSMPFLMVNLAVVDNLALATWCNLRALPALCDFINTRGCDAYMWVSAIVGTVLWPVASLAHMMATWSIVAITFSRFVSVCWATRAGQYNNIRKVKVEILVMHVLCIVFNIPRYLESKLIYDASGLAKSEKRVFAQDNNFEYIYKVFLYYMFIYVIPLGFLVYYTARLCISLRRLQKKREEMTSKSRDKADLTFSLVIVVFVFIICQLMNPIRRFLVTVYPLAAQRGCGTVYFYFVPLSSLCVTFSSGINFFIFCVCGRRFRSRLRNLFCRPARVFPLTSIFTVTGKNQREDMENSLQTIENTGH